jgi:hypothetical protein
MSLARCTLALAAVLLATSWASAQDVYVDSAAGLDENDGASEATPKRTLASVGGFGASYDTLYLRAGGTYETDELRVNNATVTSYGDGPKPVVVGLSSGVVSVGANAVIDGIAVRGASTAVGGTGFMVSGPGALIQNCEVNGTGSSLELGFGVMGEGNLITNNIVQNLNGMSGDTGDMNTSGGAEAYL